jgi:phosphodiesterase/alkaline phosphatase D-like protein
MSAYKTIRRVSVACLSVLGLAGAQLVGGAGSAAAFEGYGLPVYFGTAGSGNGQFNEPAGVAVNDTTKEVYVYDSGNLRVERFDATGSKFEGQFNGSGLLAGEGSAPPTGQFAPPAKVSADAAHGTLFNLAVDNAAASPSKGDVYVVDPGHNVIDKFTATGTYLSQLTGFTLPVFGVAVDTAGNVWAAEEGREGGEFGEGPVQEFDSAAANKHVSELTPIGLRSPGIALDSEGNLYLAQDGQNVAKFNKAGEFEESATEGGRRGTALAIDTSSNNLFFDQGESISRYLHNEEKSPSETFTGVSGSDGIAVSTTTHVIYASQLEADSIAVFTFGEFPDAITGSASEVTRTTAKLEGEVNPDGQTVTSCEFEYGLTEAYGNTVACSSAPGSGTSNVAVSAEVTGLTAGSTYHYRLLAGNSNGKHPGSDTQFTTLPAVENVITEGVTAITAHTATVEGSFEPNGYDTHYRFEYFNLRSFELREIERLQAFFNGAPGSRTMLQDAGSASEDKHVTQELTGLPPNALLIAYRIVAENQFGQTIGSPKFFKTPITAPVILGVPSAPFITAQSAVLNAKLNPEHTTTHYHFEYGACPTLAGCAAVQSTPDETSAAYGEVSSSSEIVGLSSDTTYAYRLVATNEYEEAGETKHETTIGAEATFTTGSPPLPSAQTGGDGQLAPTSALISGVVNPNGVPTSYSFEIGVYEGTNTQFGVVFSGSPGTGSVPVEVTYPLAGLQPGTTYAYRIAISSGYIDNPSHTLQGATGTFTTPGLPVVIVPPQPLAQLPVPAVAFPAGETPKTTPKLTRAQKLARALKACAKKPKSKRAGCRRAARKKYGPVKAKKK